MAAGSPLIAGIALAIGVAYAVANIVPVDTDMYWRAGLSSHYYGTVWAADANSLYVYPPPLAQAIGLLAPIGWSAFVIGWTVSSSSPGCGRARAAGACSSSARPRGAAVLWGIDSGPAKPLLLAMIGNVQPLLAAAVVIGFRWPAAWAFVILTKIAPGIGLLWFAFRREWRNLGIALAATAIIAAVSFVVAPPAMGRLRALRDRQRRRPVAEPGGPDPAGGADRDVGRDDRLGRPDEPAAGSSRSRPAGRRSRCTNGPG